MIINRCVGRSGTRVSDFTSLGVVPDRIRDPLPIPAFTSFQFPQTPMRDDPLLHELLRIRREQEQAVKSHEELDKRIRVDYMNEVQEINKKYSKLHQDNEIALAQTKNAMHTIYNTIFMNERLAEVYRSKML
ncbi:hypothetical protein MKW94_015216 [Papaver nudicaule]|uniref:Uncharacterized protein n=1 Tax=Papaver nudicaule TaxID=74823 RepID=A0AA41S403_PAPNU|nr:hypothetical protein [Papaver nudicaule]